MMPRISTNLIAYSVGGEKVYKTGESLLSTPLKIRSILLAKSFVPVLVSICMLALSSLFMVTLLPVYSYINQIGEPIPGYSFYQLLLLYPANILSGILMIFLTGSLSILSRTPRQGLYITSIVGFIFALPTILILYLAPAPLVWTTLYLFLLLVAILCFLRKVSTHVSRPMIMSKL